MSKSKGRSLANGEQGVIPEMAPKRIDAIHNAAKRLHKERDQRIAHGKEEKNAQDGLLELLDKHQLENYCYGDLQVFRETKRKVKVAIGSEPAQPADDKSGDE